MDLEALDVFCRVAAVGGVGAAARELRVTQSAVSQRLRALEKSLGKKLYGRAENRFMLTEDGRRLFQACRAGLDALRAAESELRGVEAKLRGQVRVAALGEFAKAVLLPRITRFLARHPGVSVYLDYRLPSDMAALLLRDEADLIFTNEPPRKKQIEVVAADSEEHVLVGPAPARRLSWSDLAALPWLSCRSQDDYWFEFTETLSRHGVRLPRPLIEIADIDSLLRLAAQGLGYALVPLHAVKLQLRPGLAVHRVPAWKSREAIYACRLKTVAMGRAARAFWDAMLGAPPPRR